jgi:hypothetical protein
MTHRKIKRFQIELDSSDDTQIIKIKDLAEKTLINKMRDCGYVRVLDIDPAFSISFNGETFKYLMTIHGVYIGKKKAWTIEGITQGKLIPLSIPQVTSKQ